LTRFYYSYRVYLDSQSKAVLEDMDMELTSTYTPPTMDEWWAIVDALNSIDIGAATLEGGGAACTFIEIETNGGEFILFGDVNETWTADVYASLGDLEQALSVDSFDTEVPTTNRNAADIANGYLAAWQKWAE
jgi:hypothetical protein